MNEVILVPKGKQLTECAGNGRIKKKKKIFGKHVAATVNLTVF